MSNGNTRTPVLQNEDWWACFIGWFILLLALMGWLPGTPKIAKWTSLAAAFPKGGATFGTAIFLCLTMGVLTFIAGIWMKWDLKNYFQGFFVIFGIAFISMVLSKQAFINKWGISYVLFALATLVSFAILGVGILITGFVLPIANVSSETIWAKIVPKDILGRVYSVRRTIAQISTPVGMLLAGILAVLFGLIPIMWVFTSGGLLLLAYTWFFTSFSEVEQKVKDSQEANKKELSEEVIR